MKKYATIRNYARLHHKQAGMTLIELTVVLLILVGLAGLLIPYVGSFVQKTHDSTSSSNLAQLNNAMGRFIAEKNRLPAHMSALINNADATAGTASCAAGFTDPNGSTFVNTADGIFCGMLDPEMFAATQYVATAAGVENIPLNSLKKAGFNMYVQNNPDSDNKTFNSDIGMMYLPDPYAATDSGFFAKVNGLSAASAAAAGLTGMMATTPAAHMSLALGGAMMDYNDTCYDYLAFGIGDKAELIGNTMQSSPVHFPENAELGPVQRYNHYVAIFQVDKSNTATYTEGGATKSCSSVTERAKFIGTVMNVPKYTGSHLFGVGESLSYTYENAVSKDR